MNISLENVDPAWLLAIIGIGQGAGFYWLKRDTRQVNKAVNHVEPGTPTLSERVDVANKIIEYIQAQQVVHKKETNDRFDQLETKQDQIKGQLVETKEKVDELFRVVPKRKADHNES